jgi:hypothetical protein
LTEGDLDTVAVSERDAEKVAVAETSPPQRPYPSIHPDQQCAAVNPQYPALLQQEVPGQRPKEGPQRPFLEMEGFTAAEGDGLALAADGDTNIETLLEGLGTMAADDEGDAAAVSVGEDVTEPVQEPNPA